jgi:hypothetical protein
VWTSAARAEIPSLSPKTETARTIAACTMGMPFRTFLVVMDGLGPETSVTLCRTYRRIRWSAPVIRSLEAAEAVLLGASAWSTHARCDHGLSNGNRQSYDTIPQPGAKSGRIDYWQSIFRVKLDPLLFKVETRLTAIRAVNRSQRDWQGQIVAR